MEAAVALFLQIVAVGAGIAVSLLLVGFCGLLAVILNGALIRYEQRDRRGPLA